MSNCKKCGEKAIEGQDLCWDCWVKSKSQEQPIFDEQDGLEMLKKMFGMK